MILLIILVLIAITLLFVDWITERYYIDEDGFFLEYFDNDYDYNWRRFK